MSCKIAESSVSIQAFQWPAVGTPALAAQAKPTGPLQTRKEEFPDKQQLAELERIRQSELAQCRQTALEEGRRKGYAEAAAEIENANDRLAATLRDLAGLKRRIRNEAESDVVKLSLAIARRILHRELHTDPESIQGVVYAALQKLQNREISNIRVAPDCLDAIRSALDKAGVTASVTITPDGRMRLGEVVFETALGELDASVETQLREIERGFVDRLGIAC